MPIPVDAIPHLRALSPNHILAAHQTLLAERYAFVGYHGCNHETLRNLVPHKFDPTKIGTGGGTERGDGFYVSHTYGLARDYADSSTLGEPIAPRYVAPRHDGLAGQMVVLRVYARDFLTMVDGVDFDWGVQSRAGDPNGNLNITSAAGQDFAGCAHDLELVFRTRVYSRLAAIPTVNETWDLRFAQSDGTRRWRSHTASYPRIAPS